MNSSRKSYRMPALPLRLISLALVFLQVVAPGTRLWGEMESLMVASSPVVTIATVSQAAAPVVVNKTVPQVTPPSTTLQFSANPTDQEITRARVFAEPLVPIGATTPQENVELATALLAYSQRTSSDDFAAMTQFLESHTNSPWRASLMTGLGIVYRQAGWFSKALVCWEEAWSRAKNESSPGIKATADRAVAELLDLNARLGRYDRLQELFAELEGRDINPGVSEKVSGARQGLWLMLNKPENAFRCGPMALDRIRANSIPPYTLDERILNSQSTSNGISLSGVCALANELGMNYQHAFRDPGGQFVLPAVVHWKVGHYAALLKGQDGKYLVQDPTFGDEMWVTQAALDAEASGYFLVPAGNLPSGWRTVPQEEAQTVWGKGAPGSSETSRTRPYDEKVPPCPPKTPMAQHAFHLMLVSLNIVDTPVGYAPPRGFSVFFKVTYNQKEAGQPATFTYSNLGPKWTFDWLSYITDDPVTPSNPAYCFLQGGGSEKYTGFDAGTQRYVPQPDSHTILVRNSATNYTRLMSDGSRDIFSLPDGASSYPRKIFLTQSIDPFGNALTYTYNTNFCLVAVTDALGQVTTLSYELSGDNLKITKVTDPFGRYASFQYNGSGH